MFHVKHLRCALRCALRCSHCIAQIALLIALRSILNQISCPNPPRPQIDTPDQPLTRTTLNPPRLNQDTTISTQAWDSCWSVCHGPRSARQEPKCSHACADSTKILGADATPRNYSEWPLTQQSGSDPLHHTTPRPEHRAWPTSQGAYAQTSSGSSPRLTSSSSTTRSPCSRLSPESASRSGVTSIVFWA
jgi:hypothetical protein